MIRAYMKKVIIIFLMAVLPLCAMEESSDSHKRKYDQAFTVNNTSLEHAIIPYHTSKVSLHHLPYELIENMVQYDVLLLDRLAVLNQRWYTFIGRQDAKKLKAELHKKIEIYNKALFTQPWHTIVQSMKTSPYFILNFRFIDGTTHLYRFAHKKYNASAIKYLLDQGIKQPKTNKIDLYDAIIKGHSYIVKKLIKYTDVNRPFNIKNRSTPLHVAAQYNQIKIISYLCICKNIKIDAYDGCGKTALHRAVEFYIRSWLPVYKDIYKNIIQILIDAGANPYLETNNAGYEPKNAYDMAGNFKSILKILDTNQYEK